MKSQTINFLFILFILLAAQSQNNVYAKTLSASLEVYVFPKTGQTTSQQSQDEASCYEWATSNVGADPFDLSKQTSQQQAETNQAKSTAQNSIRGTGTRGALRGAAAGAIIGEIANDDPGRGAAVGAGTGAIVGRGRGRIAQRDAVQQVEQQGQSNQNATQHQIDNFKKAFGVCLEAKEYLVKY